MWWILGGLTALFLLSRASGGSRADGAPRGPDDAPRGPGDVSDEEILEAMMQYVVLDAEPASDQRLDISGQARSLMTGRDVGDLGAQIVHVHPGPGRAFNPAADNPASLSGFEGVGHVKSATAVSEGGHVGMTMVSLFYP